MMFLTRVALIAAPYKSFKNDSTRMSLFLIISSICLILTGDPSFRRNTMSLGLNVRNDAMSDLFTGSKDPLANRSVKLLIMSCSPILPKEGALDIASVALISPISKTFSAILIATPGRQNSLFLKTFCGWLNGVQKKLSQFILSSSFLFEIAT